MKYLYVKATILDEGIIEVKYKLDDIIRLVNTASFKIQEASPLQRPLDILLSICPLEMLEHHRAMQTHDSRDSSQQLGTITEARLIELHKELKKTLSEYQRSHFRWDVLVEESILLEDVINSYHSQEQVVKSIVLSKRVGNFVMQREKMEWMWLTRIKPFLCRILGIFFTMMSILIIIGETTLFLTAPIGLFPIMFHSDHGINNTQILCLIPLLYILLCTQFGLFNLKLPGWYGLYPNNHTDSSNMAWSAFYLARLTAPLSYNFLLFLKIKKTVFSDFMHIIDIVPIVGSDFAMFFPLLLIVFCAMNYFNIYGKFLNALGMNQLSFSGSYCEEKLQEGKSLIQRSRSERERKAGVTAIKAVGAKLNLELTKSERNDPRKPSIKSNYF